MLRSHHLDFSAPEEQVEVLSGKNIFSHPRIALIVRSLFFNFFTFGSQMLSLGKLFNFQNSQGLLDQSYGNGKMKLMLIAMLPVKC